MMRFFYPILRNTKEKSTSWQIYSQTHDPDQKINNRTYFPNIPDPPRKRRKKISFPVFLLRKLLSRNVQSREFLVDDDVVSGKSALQSVRSQPFLTYRQGTPHKLVWGERGRLRHIKPLIHNTKTTKTTTSLGTFPCYSAFTPFLAFTRTSRILIKTQCNVSTFPSCDNYRVYTS